MSGGAIVDVATLDELDRGLVGGLQQAIGGTGVVAQDARLIHHGWLYRANGDVFEPGSDPWTVSVAHTGVDVARHVENFETFASAVAG